jgi:hypothetical protein
MADLASISAALTSVKTMWDLARNLQDTHVAMQISSELGNIQGRLIDVQQQALAVQEENQRLRSELDNYKSLKQHHSVIWRELPDGKEDGPFCPICIAQKREMRLGLNPFADQMLDYWRLYCPQGHVAKQGIQLAPGPFFQVPKSLVADNYFFTTRDK